MSLGDNNVNVKITTSADTKGVDEAKSSLNSLSQESERSGGITGRLSDAFGSFGRTLATVGSAFVAYGIIQKVEEFGAVAFSTAGELEQTNMSFQNLIGNTKEANALFADLVQYANTTPFQAKDVTDAAKQLLAFGETASDTTKVVKQLGDVAAAGGGDLKAMALVSGQVFAQGKMRAQDMYQVINDGGAGLIKIMADNVGGMQNLTAEFDHGGIPAKQYFDAINKATADGGFAFDGANKQAKTFNGEISTLKDSVAQFGMSLIGVHVDANGLGITPGGVFDRLKGAIGGLSTDLAKVGPIAGRAMGDLLFYSGEAFKKITSIASEYIDWNKIMDKTNFYIHDFITAMRVIITGDPDQGMFKEQKYKDLGTALSHVRTAISDIAHDFKTILVIVIGDVQTAWDKLKPSVDALWHTFKNDLLPALNDFWTNYGPAIKTLLKDLAIVFGVTLFAAIWLAINAINVILKVFSGLMQFIDDHKAIVIALATAFGVLAAAMAFNAIVNAMIIGFNTLTLVTIPSLMASVETLTATITAPIVMPALLIGAALASIALVMKAISDARNAWDNAQAAANSAQHSWDTAHQKELDLYRNGTPAQKAAAKKALDAGYATGTSNATAGWHWVGEEGPELMNFGGGEQVIPAKQSQQIASAGGHTTYNIQSVNLTTADATREFFNLDNRNGQLASMGLSIMRPA